MTHRALLFVESNTSGTGELFVDATRALGLRPVLITAAPDRYAFLSRAAGTDADALEVVVVPAIEPDGLSALIRARFNQGRDVAGITSTSEFFIAAAAALAARFGCPGPDPTRVREARNKAWQRRVLADAGFPTPPFRAVWNPEEAAAAARAIGTSVVVKPVNGSGSTGVRLCETADEARVHAQVLFDRPVRERHPVLVEAFVEGPEFSVELMSGQVIGVTRKHLGAAPYFVETGHDYPAPVADGVARALAETASRAAAALGLTWGPIHWELRWSAGRAWPIEVNPRLAGGFIPELIRRAQGIELIRETIRLVTGSAPDLRPTRDAHASIRFVIAPRSGRLSSIEGLERARTTDGVVEVSLYRQAGDELVVQGDFKDRIGHVIATGVDARAAADAATHACAGLGIGVVSWCPAETETAPC